MRLLGTGAEASLFLDDYLGLPAVVKRRSAKSYRHPELDRQLRSSRTRREARLLREARRAGVRTPLVYDVDLQESVLILEMVEGEKLRVVLEERPEDAPALCRRVGEALGRLHSGRVAHGDLTTSNMILMPDGEICLLDISLGESMADLEAMGVDVHLFRRAFLSAHSSLEDAYDDFLEGYSGSNPEAAAVLARAEDIEGRGRYT